MENCIFRPAKTSDLDDIISNWVTAFGDCPDFPRRLLLDCGLLEDALAAECDGRVVSSLLLFHGLELGANKASYLYALCTNPEFEGRGIGSALTRFAAQKCRLCGADMLILRPGDDGLEAWYARQGFRVLWRYGSKSLDISGISAPAAQKLSAEEYLSSRRGTLTAAPQLLAAESTIHSLFGGAFLRTGRGHICAEFDGFILSIRDCDCKGSELLSAAASAAAHFGAEHVSLRCRDDRNGDIPLMYLPLGKDISPLPEGLFFPFTLD